MTVERDDLEKIKQRIAKLLRMADDASSPNEAAIAASRARKLMDQYQIESADLNGEIDDVLVERGHGRFFAAIPLYLTIFCVSVAKYNDCQAKLEGGRVTFKKRPGDPIKWGKRPLFQGYENDVQLCCDMYDRLEEAVNRLCKEYMDGLGLPKYNVKIGGQFKHGAVHTITQRINAMLVERESLIHQSTGKGLMVIKSLAVIEKFGEPNYRNSGNVFKEDDEDAIDAVNAGIKAGNKVEIIPLVD